MIENNNLINPNQRYQPLLEGLDRFNSLKVAIIGDLILDSYIYGLCNRISREAPVMIVERQRDEYRLGGAANAANNISGLSASAFLFSVIGESREDDSLVSLASSKSICLENCIVDPEYQTAVKTRIMVGNSPQQTLRLDHLPKKSVSSELRSDLQKRLIEQVKNFDAFIFSDYGFGLLDQYFSKKLTEVLKSRKTFADSRDSLSDFPSLYFVTPNLEEGMALTGKKDPREIILNLGERNDENVLLTLGKDGMLLLDQTGDTRSLFHVGIYGKTEVVDVTGAGDTVISTLALSSAAGLNPLASAILASYASGIVVRKRGTARIDFPELVEAVAEDRRLEVKQIEI